MHLRYTGWIQFTLFQLFNIRLHILRAKLFSIQCCSCVAAYFRILRFIACKSYVPLRRLFYRRSNILLKPLFTHLKTLRNKEYKSDCIHSYPLTRDDHKCSKLMVHMMLQAYIVSLCKYEYFCYIIKIMK